MNTKLFLLSLNAFVCIIPQDFLLSKDPSSSQRQSLWPITTAANYDRLRSQIAEHLATLTKARIEMIKKDDKNFAITKDFISKQQAAQRNFSEKVLPLITKTEPLLMIDLKAIEKLSSSELRQVLEGCFKLLGYFPPLPAQAKEWSNVITPLLVFDKQDRSYLSEVLEGWLDRLLERGDMENLASLAQLSQQKQQAKLKELRRGYTDLTNPISQLLYTWVQVSTVLSKKDPLRAFLRYATTKPNALEQKFMSLRKQAKKALAQQGKEDIQDSDADGLILLSIASLFAPEETWKELARLSSSQKRSKS